MSKNELVKDSLIYGLTNALFTGLPLILMPFLVVTLSPSDYGVVELFRSLTMVLVPVLGLSTVQSVARYYFDLEEKQFKTFSSTIIVFQIINGAIGILLILIFSFLIEEKYLILAYLSVIYFIFNQVTEILLAIFRVTKSSKMYMKFRLLNVILDVGLLAVFYFLFDKYTWMYRVFPQVIAVVLVGFLALWYFFRREKNKICFDKALLKVAITYSAPLILHMLSGYMLNIGDRFFILHFLDEEALGNYSLAYQISLAVSFFYTSFNLAWTPTFFEWMDQKRYQAIKKVRDIVFVGVFLLGVGSVLLFFLLQKFIPKMESYNINYSLIILLVSANILLCFYKFNANYYFYNKNTKLLSKISLFGAFLVVVFNFLLIPNLGIIGAAITTLITFSFMLLMVIYKKDKFNLYNETN